ncbi:HAD family hydrolase [Pontibacter sp. G13]|uniref:HAD family hydrolase n=1 Tax=Pontibacter sp. G13 TaxID=3074898 RepID=UPI00288BA918|nr:HAD family hydrolase [Pontibacter sp. G13]WNJ21013.1 HAD family hydrolase [Pontibacter sp. G13]
MKSRIIFDCDGVIVDSEILAAQNFLEALAQFDYTPNLDEYTKIYAGKKDTDIVRILKDELGLKLPEGFLEETHQKLKARFAEELKVIPGMGELIRGLEMPKAVVSNSDLKHVEMCLELAGLSEVFGDRIFSADQVANPKPAPDVYEFAIEQLGWNKEECLVVEDSLTGVEAAVGAGLEVVGFLGAGHIMGNHGEQVLALGAQALAENANSLQSYILQTVQS